MHPSTTAEKPHVIATEDQVLLNFSSTARYLKMSVGAISDLVDNGNLKPVYVGRKRLFFIQSELDEFIENQRRANQ